MTLLLPLLMLGFAVAAEQPQPVSGDQRPVVATIRNGTLPPMVMRRPFTMSQSENPFFSQERRAQASSSDAQDEARKQTCFTMRSYFFEREDDQGMQFLGMTRCDPGRAVTQKHVRSVPRLVPAN